MPNASSDTTRRSPSPHAAFAAIAVGVASIALLQNLVIPVIPLIRADFGVGADAAAWAMTAWLMAAAVATPLLGRVGDLHGRRRAFIAVLAVVAAGDVLAMAAPNLGVLIGARLLQGAGGALFPLAFGMLRDVYPRDRLTGAIGAMSAVMGIGGAAGSVLAGPVAELAGWRGTFAIPVIASALGAALVLRFVPAHAERAQGRVNLLSAVLLSGWLVALLLPLSSGARWGWASPAVLGLFAAAGVLLAAWIAVELRADEPLVDLRLLAGRAVWPVNVSSLLTGIASFGFWGYLPQFLETPTNTGWGLGLDVRAAGIALVPLLIGMSGIGFLSGTLTRFITLRVQLAAGAALMAIGMAWVVLAHVDVLVVALAGGVFGVGLGLAYAAAASLIVQGVPADRTGVATGANANLRTIGAAIGSAVISTMVFGSTDAAGHPAEAAYGIAWAVVAALAVIGGVIVIAVRPRPVREPQEVALVAAP